MRINKERRVKAKRDSVRSEVYHSKKWKLTRVVVLDRDNHLCQECKRNGFIAVTGRTVDHIQPVKRGGSVFGLHNLETLCDTCHARKSQSEKN